MEPLLNIQLLKAMASHAEQIAANLSDPEWKRTYQKVAEGTGLLWRKLDEAIHNHKGKKA